MAHHYYHIFPQQPPWTTKVHDPLHVWYKYTVFATKGVSFEGWLSVQRWHVTLGCISGKTSKGFLTEGWNTFRYVDTVLENTSYSALEHIAQKDPVGIQDNWGLRNTSNRTEIKDQHPTWNSWKNLESFLLQRFYIIPCYSHRFVYYRYCKIYTSHQSNNLNLPRKISR